MNSLEIFKALSDDTRLRILHLLFYEPLNVSEIISILKMGQSRISRHLKILQDAGILIAVREGSKIYYGIDPKFRIHPVYDAWSQMIQGNHKFWDDSLNKIFQKDKELFFIIQNKRKLDALEFFDKFGDLQEKDQNLYVDAEYYKNLLLEEVDNLKSEIRIAVEPGCGTGWISVELARKVKKLICIDQSTVILNKAKSKFPRELLKKTEFITASMENLPVKDEIADLVIFSMALHHVPNIHLPLKEAYRVLKKGKTLLVVDLENHEYEEMRKNFADFWLGFHLEDLKKELLSIPFEIQKIKTGKGKGKINNIFLKCTK